MEKKIKVLFVDDEEKFTANMARRLSLRDLEVAAFTDGEEALTKTEGQQFDVALIDLKMPGMSGEELLKRLKERDPILEVVILTGHGSIKSAAECTRSGAFEYLIKPCELDDVITAITRAYAQRIKARDVEKAKQVDEMLGKALGLSPIELLRELKRIKEG
jgi:DNA-binding NtrC family response regulator